VIGRTISHYQVLEELGRGGMGVLYRARDTRLGRTVAIKVLRPDAISSTDRRQRFVREAQAASALNHPRIVTIYDIDRYTADAVERDFIVMEHVDGSSLDRLLEPGPLGLDEALDRAVQVAEALAAAHEAGIIHRDIKPANIMVTVRGDVKLVDFGLAKLTEPSSHDTETPTKTAQLRTEEGAVIGTAAYMSPEQAEGHAVDRRTDIFSFGSVFYEMLTGRRAFQGDSQVTMRMAILGQTPAPVRSFRKEVPADVERVVSRCLEKKREARYASGTDLLQELRRVWERRAARRRVRWSRPRVAVPAAIVAAALLGAGASLWVHSNRVRWARYEALPEITRLTAKADDVSAFDLFERARPYLPDDPELERLRNALSVPASVRTEPAGAEVAWKEYSHPESGWRRLGLTPVEGRLPAVYCRWRIEKPGFETMERAGYPRTGFSVTLTRQGTGPAGMVFVPPGQQEIGGKPVPYDGFWLDKFEVTNRRFKAFVDAGGYRSREYWRQPFVKDGREVSWEEALRLFVDKTGRPGPALWELGNFPQGEDEYPVRGISWFEAAALAEFDGKSLPTVWHWLRATGDGGGPAAVVELSNFDGKGPARVGDHQGLGPFGTYDMAGNVREWAFNASGDRRSTLGGAWNEIAYTYRSRFAISPFERSETHGFRLAKYEKPPAPELLASIERTWRDYSREKSVDDRTFAVYAGLYAYDKKTPLEAKAEPVASGSSHWKQERVEYAAAYGDERIPADLYLPTNARPPFQTVLYFPGSNAQTGTRIDAWDSRLLDFIIQSGRAVLYPVYKGTYERRLRSMPARNSSAYRDLVIQDHKDLARSVDYLETRKDVDIGRLAYFGNSWGAVMGLNHTALEKRFRASILVAGGLDNRIVAPEIDQLNFAPRVTVPTLMLNGREDFYYPYEESQKAMVLLLGSKAKQHVRVPGGHVIPRLEIIKATLEWLDRYLGPVETQR
jgi:predicted esterase/predicted Ser/Thr protein kinase